MQALLDVLGITFDFSWVMSVGQILMNYIVNNKYHHLSPSILGDILYSLQRTMTLSFICVEGTTKPKCVSFLAQPFSLWSSIVLCIVPTKDQKETE